MKDQTKADVPKCGGDHWEGLWASLLEVSDELKGDTKKAVIEYSLLVKEQVKAAVYHVSQTSGGGPAGAFWQDGAEPMGLMNHFDITLAMADTRHISTLKVAMEQAWGSTSLGCSCSAFSLLLNPCVLILILIQIREHTSVSPFECF